MYHFSCHLFLVTYDSSVSVEGFEEFPFGFRIVLETISEIGFRSTFVYSEISFFSSLYYLSNEIVVYSVKHS